MKPGRRPAPISEKEKERIARALSSGLPIRHLHRSGRFKGVSMERMAQIADEMGAPRNRQSGKRKRPA
jgi:hypothetical protein